MTDDSKFNDDKKPPKDRKPFQFDQDLKQATEEVKKVIIQEEKEVKQNGETQE